MVQRSLYSTIEMMQAVAKITTSRIQNDMRMLRRNSLHHGSFIYKYSSSSVSPTNLRRKEKKKTKKQRKKNNKETIKNK